MSLVTNSLLAHCPLDIEMSHSSLDWTILEQHPSVAIVVPLVPIQGFSTDLCSRPPVCVASCQFDPNCAILTGLCLTRHHAPPFLEILDASVLSVASLRSRARLSTRLVVPQVFGFWFDSRSQCKRWSHTMNSFLGTLDFRCRSLTNPSVLAACFMPIERFRLHWLISSILSCHQCWSASDLDNIVCKLLTTTPIMINSDNVSFASCSQGVTRVSKNCRESMRSSLNVVPSKIQVSEMSRLLKLCLIVRYASSPSSSIVLSCSSTWSTRDTAQWTCCEPIPQQSSVPGAPGHGRLLNRFGVL